MKRKQVLGLFEGGKTLFMGLNYLRIDTGKDTIFSTCNLKLSTCSVFYIQRDTYRSA